jgi:hypothetical protein
MVPLETSTPLLVVQGTIPFIQNCNTDALKVKRGSGAAAEDFDFILAGCTAEDDGTGGATGGDGPLKGYFGTVSFYSATYRYVASVQAI